MQTQIKLNVNDELFDKAAEEILTAKIKELARKSVKDETINDIVANLTNSVRDRYLEGQYFEIDYGRLRPTKELLRLIIDSLGDSFTTTMTEYFKSEEGQEYLYGIIKKQIQIRLEKDNITHIIDDVITENFKAEISKIARKRFDEMLKASTNQ